MSRRDTIIIAVLVNAAILLILFATAMRSDSKKSKEEAATPLVKEESCELDETVAANLPDCCSTDDQAIEILGGVTEIPLDKGESAEPLPQIIAAKPTVTAPAMTAPAPSKGVAAMAPKAPCVSTVTQSAALAVSHPASNSSLPSKEEAISSVTVKKGDALEKIARAHHTTTAAIMKANNLTSTQLKVGQVLKVPSASAVETVSNAVAPSAVAKKESPASSKALPVASKTSTVASTPSHEGFYTVKEGDNPWLIASRVGIKLEDLLRLNGIDNEKAKKLRPGDKLRVR